MEPTGDLAAALEVVLGDASGAGLQAAAERLTSAYRADVPPGEVLGTPLAARAYAAYRMPATAAAVRAALRAAGLGNAPDAPPRGNASDAPPRGNAPPSGGAPDAPLSGGAAGALASGGAAGALASGGAPDAPLPGGAAGALASAGAAGGGVVPAISGGAGAAAGGPGLRTLVDVGGGTGAALWAAAEVVPGLVAATVLDRSGEAIELGRRLAARSGSALVRTATWTQGPLGRLPAADLVTMAYVLTELPAATRTVLLGAVEATTVAIVEPGTPAGYRRILDARDILLERGFRVLAPCPHDARCPLAGTADWCHFAARLPRSARHRRAKGGTLGWEDEKFAYVVATRAPATPAPGRILRHPAQRKGLVELTVCAPAGIERVTVSKRQGPLYRAARDAGWGDPWPPG